MNPSFEVPPISVDGSCSRPAAAALLSNQTGSEALRRKTAPYARTLVSEADAYDKKCDKALEATTHENFAALYSEGDHAAIADVEDTIQQAGEEHLQEVITAAGALQLAAATHGAREEAMLTPEERGELNGARQKGKKKQRVLGPSQAALAALTRKPRVDAVQRPRNGLHRPPPSRAAIKQTAEDGGLSVGRALNTWKPDQASLHADGISAQAVVIQVSIGALLTGLPRDAAAAPLELAGAAGGIVTNLPKLRKTRTMLSQNAKQQAPARLVDAAARLTAVAAGVAAALPKIFVATTDKTDTLGVTEMTRLLLERGVPCTAHAAARGMGPEAKAEVVKFIKERAGSNPTPSVWRTYAPRQFRYIKIKAPADAAPAAPPPQYTTPGGKGRAPARDHDEDDDWLELMDLLDGE